jgi:hypothetical protein
MLWIRSIKRTYLSKSNFDFLLSKSNFDFLLSEFKILFIQHNPSKKSNMICPQTQPIENEYKKQIKKIEIHNLKQQLRRHLHMDMSEYEIDLEALHNFMDGNDIRNSIVAINMLMTNPILHRMAARVFKKKEKKQENVPSCGETLDDF